MFGMTPGGLPLGMYQKLQKDYPGGKGLKGMMALALAQYTEDKRLFGESQRAEGDAGSVQYAYTDPFSEEEEEEEAAPAPEQKFGYGFGGIYGGAGMVNKLPGSPGYKQWAQKKAFNKTTGGDPEFQAWLASKYGKGN